MSSLILLFTVLAFGVPSALAISGNYYGIAHLQGSDFFGDKVTVRANSLAVPDHNTDAIIADNWVVDAPAYDFIEAGIEYGNASYEQCRFISSSPAFFWADQRPNGGGYHCHAQGDAQLNTYYTSEIKYEGVSQWSVTIGALENQQSTASLLSSNLIETGAEETTQSGVTCSSQKDLAWYDTSGRLHSGWTDSTGAAGRSEAEPPYAYWVVNQQWLRAYSNTSC